MLALGLALLISGCGRRNNVDVFTGTFDQNDGRGKTSTVPPNPENMGSLLAFEYNYGSYTGGEWEFKIINQTTDIASSPQYLFTARGYNGVDMDAKGFVEAGVIDDLAKLIYENGIISWNGFNERNSDILDGYGFKLIAQFDSGTLIASGYETYPDDYRRGHAALAEYLNALAGKVMPVEIESADNIQRITVRFYDSLGSYNMWAARGISDAGMFEEYALYMAEQCNRFKDESKYTDGEYCMLSLWTDTFNFDAFIYKARHPDAYAQILEKSLAIDGKPMDYLSSEEYQRLLYKDGFIYPAAYVYDADGLGKMVVDLPEQTITVNNVVYKTSREEMLKFYEFVEAIPKGTTSNSGISRIEHTLVSGYLDDGQTAQSVFEEFISAGNTWLIGKNHKGNMFVLYGGKGDKPDGWNDMIAEFEKLLNKAYQN